MTVPVINAVINFSTGPSFAQAMILDTGILGTNVLADSAGVIVDVSNQVNRIETNRGRTALSDQFQTGTMTLRIVDQNGDFNPQNVSGPYYNLLTPMKKVQITATARMNLYICTLHNGLKFNITKLPPVDSNHDNQTKYQKANQPWCRAFVNWCAKQVSLKIPDCTYTPNGAKAFVKEGTWQDAEGATPLPGDLAFFDLPLGGIFFCEVAIGASAAGSGCAKASVNRAFSDSFTDEEPDDSLDLPSG